MAGVTPIDGKLQEQKLKSLDNVLGQIEKSHGKGAVMRLGDDVRPPIEVIPTGAIALDVALGIGGLPRGRIVEVYGPESSGKTTVALHAVANAQRAGGIAAFIDAEHALDPEYAKKLGVDIDALLVSQPDTGEQALEITETLRSATANAGAEQIATSVSSRSPQGYEVTLADETDAATVRLALTGRALVGDEGAGRVPHAIRERDAITPMPARAAVAQHLALIWLAHIGIDRALGYGLKYGAGFGFTHLGRIGKYAGR